MRARNRREHPSRTGTRRRPLNVLVFLDLLAARAFCLQGGVRAIMESASISVKLLEFREGMLKEHGDDILGVVDSLGLVELVKFIENAFGIQIGLEEVTCTAFRDLKSVEALVESKTHAIGRP
jgi:acyl carrier protein